MNSNEILVLDGGQATELEARGLELGDALWSARILAEAPDEIAAVHRLYLEAGADCITTMSYQATLEGFEQAGFDREKAKDLLRSSVKLAKRTRDEFWSSRPKMVCTKPLVAASIGPYGAFLANGAEYTGEYGISTTELVEFHTPRWQILAAQDPDVMLAETLPCLKEAQVLAELAESTPGIPVWMSFSCRDAVHTSSGVPICECAKALDGFSQVAAIGVNCIRPEFVTDLIKQIRSVTSKRIIVFPNSGETYDADKKQWEGESEIENFGGLAGDWIASGATIIGGCCRTTPDHIRAVRNVVSSQA